MKAVIYARYSSHNQREESIEGQLRECRAFADREKMTVVHEYCDHALSGTNDKRPQFQKLIADSDKHIFDAVIMYTLDRFARNRYDSAIYKNKLKKNGVRLYYVKQPMPEGPEGIILEAVLEGYAEYYSENLSRNIKRGMSENALKGLSNGHVPFGYRVVDHRYQIDPVSGDAVKKMFEMYAAGSTFKEISEYLNARGCKTSHGNPFRPTSNFPKMLSNEKYIGIYRFGEIVSEDTIPPIVEKELFEKVQKMLKDKKPKRRNHSDPEDLYLLTGKIFCGHCSTPMIGESGKGRHGTVYRYYTCSDRKHKHSCDKKPERKSEIEDFVIDFTIKNVLTDDNINMIADKTMAAYNRRKSDHTVLNELKAQLKEARKKSDKLMDAILDGFYNKSMNEKAAQIDEEIEILEAAVADEAARVNMPELTREHVVFWLSSFKSQNQDIKWRKRIIDALIHAVYVYDETDPGGRRITITYNATDKSGEPLRGSSEFPSGPPNDYYPNHFFSLGYVFGFVVKL